MRSRDKHFTMGWFCYEKLGWCEFLKNSGFFHFLFSFFHHLAWDDPALLKENRVRFFSANFCGILGTIYDHISAFLEGVVANFVHKMRLHDVSHFVIFCQFWTITPIFQPNLAKICYNSKKNSWLVLAHKTYFVNSVRCRKKTAISFLGKTI